MNTIEQAREMVKRLRDEGDSITKSEVAGTIDVLILEVETFHEANKKLRSELDALKQQEPVARFNWNTSKFEWLTEYSYDKHHMKPLFLEAGAQTAPAGHVLLSEDAVKMTLNCLCTPERANLWLVLRDLNKAMLAAAPVQAVVKDSLTTQERKPLSCDEIDKAIQQHVDPVATYLGLHRFARAIEAKIKGRP